MIIQTPEYEKETLKSQTCRMLIHSRVPSVNYGSDPSSVCAFSDGPDSSWIGKIVISTVKTKKTQIALLRDIGARRLV